jgi:hypothetical protein
MVVGLSLNKLTFSPKAANNQSREKEPPNEDAIDGIDEQTEDETV